MSYERPRYRASQGSMTCFYCHHPGHMKQDCPQKHESQDFRPMQFQSSVGQARTPFIPSHFGTGQKNQFQSQGATQAPSAVHMGQRGQSMGRGQVQGPQARTSRT